ncbi:hypothetical protein VNO78_03358 [Psophocarpus tetragonolobus]|uniref:Uncharacterized protein n=1 Tax=Psophocarpus tetragonolobus TaxID=3891 RepID=A0AAN9XWV6_PSOTE
MLEVSSGQRCSKIPAKICSHLDKTEVSKMCLDFGDYCWYLRIFKVVEIFISLNYCNSYSFSLLLCRHNICYHFYFNIFWKVLYGSSLSVLLICAKTVATDCKNHYIAHPPPPQEPPLIRHPDVPLPLQKPLQ